MFAIRPYACGAWAGLSSEGRLGRYGRCVVGVDRLTEFLLSTDESVLFWNRSWKDESCFEQIVGGG
jgi:hypothetical protein